MKWTVCASFICNETLMVEAKKKKAKSKINNQSNIEAIFFKNITDKNGNN